MATNVSDILGEYMLKGWILTDRGCPNADCGVPLMRSPAARSPTVHFCAGCDNKPDSTVERPSLQLVASVEPSISSISSGSHLSRASTPPTELSSGLSSPTFALPPETAESRRRREQSDIASTEIGRRLLKGWAMLAEECPNTQCYGVPLVRAPRSNDTDEPIKECVVCETRYLSTSDWAGRPTLTPVVTGPPVSGPDFAGLPVSSARLASPGKPPTPTGPQHIQPDVLAPSPALTSTSTGTVLSTLDNAAAALERSLQSLTAKLVSLTDGTSPMDPSAIGAAADAVTKTTQALTQVKQLQWSEKQNLMQ
ncbi:hypothetical protein CYLTODRAFT_190909 [Cylindrobasidium torrendii FP15055 ss-10]|uniref:Sjogrens syndrome scleroderma autoantigen 1 family protein n=1 Tax=Cylindrobasidium torrendii FP15055 ss-10 TaxID=1314674 RepID=A0A0D7BTY4_9AGAR|nr:hypothetical protein CYLTODRAFT_190909 [Cylindrobasidium torrendii FP15055 ss-10]